MKQPFNLYTTGEAAKLIGCRPQYLAQRIKQGVIKAQRAGSFYLISESELENFKKNYNPRKKV